MPQNRINILVNGDARFSKVLATSLLSLRTNLPESVSITCYYAFYSGQPMAKRQIDLFRHQLSKTDCLRTIEIPDYPIDTSGARWNKQVFLKVLALFFLPRNIDGVLYFDGDVVFDGSVLPFYEYGSASTAVLVGTKECFESTPQVLSRCQISDGLYLNGGVLFIKPWAFVKEWKSPEGFLSAYSAAPFPKLMLEQDFLNYAFDGRKEAFRDDTYMHFVDNSWVLDQSYRSTNPVAYHFAGYSKPWERKVGSYYDDVFWKYGRHVYPLLSRMRINVTSFYALAKTKIRSFLKKLAPRKRGVYD